MELNEKQKKQMCDILRSYVEETYKTVFELAEDNTSLSDFFEYIGFVTKEDRENFRKYKAITEKFNEKFGEAWQ